LLKHADLCNAPATKLFTDSVVRRNFLYTFSEQIDLISEKGITKILQLTRAICTQMGLKNVADDAELKELSEETSV
jgi:hypothetical protein